MILRRRRAPRLPAELRRRVGETPHAAAELTDGRWAAATSSALVLLGTGEEEPERHPWHTVQRGAWDGEERALTVTWVEGDREAMVLRTAHDEVAAFNAAFRERVQSSVVHSEVVETPRGAELRVDVRRDEGGGLLSRLTVTGPWSGDAEERRLADDLEDRARAAVGLPT